MGGVSLALVLVVSILIFMKVYTKRKDAMELQNPPTVEELGRCAWTWLHSVAANYKEEPSLDEQKGMANLIFNFARFYPCRECATNLKSEMKELPPVVDSRRNLEGWLCKLHNKVNERLNKPTFDCSLSSYRWRGLSGCQDDKCSLAGSTPRH
jgi:FAD-linked sulfhydryl oxidase